MVIVFFQVSLLINQSINRSINQSINRSINRSISGSSTQMTAFFTWVSPAHDDDDVVWSTPYTAQSAGRYSGTPDNYAANCWTPKRGCWHSAAAATPAAPAPAITRHPAHAWNSGAPISDSDSSATAPPAYPRPRSWSPPRPPKKVPSSRCSAYWPPRWIRSCSCTPRRSRADCRACGIPPRHGCECFDCRRTRCSPQSFCRGKSWAENRSLRRSTGGKDTPRTMAAVVVVVGESWRPVIRWDVAVRRMDPWRNAAALRGRRAGDGDWRATFAGPFDGPGSLVGIPWGCWVAVWMRGVDSVAVGSCVSYLRKKSKIFSQFWIQIRNKISILRLKTIKFQNRSIHNKNIRFQSNLQHSTFL